MDLLVSSQPPVRASARRLGPVADRAGVRRRLWHWRVRGDGERPPIPLP